MGIRDLWNDLSPGGRLEQQLPGAELRANNRAWIYEHGGREAGEAAQQVARAVSRNPRDVMIEAMAHVRIAGGMAGLDPYSATFIRNNRDAINRRIRTIRAQGLATVAPGFFEGKRQEAMRLMEEGGDDVETQ